jgi:alcohol dehydrogenase class IV
MSDQKPLSGRFNLLPMEGVVFGPGTFEQTGAECTRLGMERIFLILSPSLARVSDVEERLQAQLGDKIVLTYKGSQPHVPDTVVLDAAAQARAAGVDGILAVGGGSPIDIAKAVNLCLAEGVTTREELLEYAVKFTYPDTIEVPPIKGTALPQVSVPTTLSAGEFSNITGITDTVEMVKNMYIDDQMTAKVVIHDPELAVHTPRDLWASTGMRAFDHCVEGLCSTSAQPMTDALCADALRRLATYLPISAKDPSDMYAAGQCLMGAWQSLFGLTNVTMGLSHGVGHQLGARNAVPHGITSCVMLPTVLDYNLEHTVEQQAVVAGIVAEAMGEPVPTQGASDIVRRFIENLGLPTRLSEVGVTRDDFPFLARDAMQDMIVATNPRPVDGEPDVVKILEQAF